MLWTIAVFNKLKRYQGPDIKNNAQRYQLVPCYDVSQKSVSFRYELKRLCEVLSWSVSLRYELVHHYDVTNCSVLFTYQWDVAKASQIGPSYSRTCCDVAMMSQHGPRRPDLYETWLRRRYDVTCRVGIFFCYQDMRITFSICIAHIQYQNLFNKLPNSFSLFEFIW